jgi:hypothetical protein
VGQLPQPQPVNRVIPLTLTLLYSFLVASTILVVVSVTLLNNQPPHLWLIRILCALA